MDRRSFFRRGLLGGAILAAGSLTLALWPPRARYAPKRWLQVLDPGDFAVLAAIAARTTEGAGGDPLEIAHAVDLTLSRTPPEAQAEMRQLLSLFESGLAGLILDRRLRPFTYLPPEEQDAVLAAWRDSRLLLRRSGYIALRKLTLAAHYAQPSTWSGVGYPGPPEIAEG